MAKVRLNNQIRAEILRWADGAFFAPAEEAEALAAHAALQVRIDEVISGWATPGEIATLRKFGAAERVSAAIFLAPGEYDKDHASTYQIPFGSGGLVHATRWRSDARGRQSPVEGVREIDHPSMTDAATRIVPSRHVSSARVCVPELRGSPEVAAWAFARGAWRDKLVEQRSELREALSRLTMADDAAQLHPGIPAHLLQPAASALVPLAAAVNLAALKATPVRA